MKIFMLIIKKAKYKYSSKYYYSFVMAKLNSVFSVTWSLRNHSNMLIWGLIFIGTQLLIMFFSSMLIFWLIYYLFILFYKINQQKKTVFSINN